MIAGGLTTALDVKDEHEQKEGLRHET